MKTKQEIQPPRRGRNSLWEEELSERRIKIAKEIRVRHICSCKNGDLYFEKNRGYQSVDDCSSELACFKIRKDMREYGSGWPSDE